MMWVLCRCDSGSCRNVGFSCRICVDDRLMGLVRLRDGLWQDGRCVTASRSTDNGFCG